jgi:hypothetical protein
MGPIEPIGPTRSGPAPVERVLPGERSSRPVDRDPERRDGRRRRQDRQSRPAPPDRDAPRLDVRA